MNSSSNPVSNTHPLSVYGDMKRITTIFYWFAGLMVVSLIAGIFILLSNANITEAILTGLFILPGLLSLYLIHRQKFEGAAAFMALIMISLMTLLAIRGQGIHNISILGFPAVLIIASLVTRKRTMILLTLFNVGCVAWLVFGELAGIYTPNSWTHSVPGDFFSVSLVVVATAVMVRMISESFFKANRRLQKELKERKQIEEEHKALIKELESKNAELERFTYTVSHDLKSPLITITGFLGYLEEDATAGNIERVRHDSLRIKEAVSKMKLLLDELLELSRIGRLMNPPEDVAFEDLINEALKTARGRLEARGVTIDIQPNLPCIHGDRQRLVEVLQNLIDNAAKFMGDQPVPQIEFGCQEREETPVFFVKDNGIGIEPRFHEQIFGLFNKLNPSIDGTGVGLALVRRIIEVHGGRIWVESELGRGATFYFTLPVVKVD
jgi:signal transduction histidine kinase